MVQYVGTSNIVPLSTYLVNIYAVQRLRPVIGSHDDQYTSLQLKFFRFSSVLANFCLLNYCLSCLYASLHILASFPGALKQ